MTHHARREGELDDPEPAITDLASCRSWIAWFEDGRHSELASLRGGLRRVPDEYWATVRDQLVTELEVLATPIHRVPGERTRFDSDTHQRLLAGKKLTMVMQDETRRSRANRGR